MSPIRFISHRTRVIAASSSAAIVLVVGLAVGIGLARVLARQAKIRNSEAVVRTNDNVLQRLTDAETGQRGYIIVGDSSYLAPYRGATADVRRESARLHELISDDPASQRLLAALDSLIPRRLAALDRVMGTRTRAGVDSARVSMSDGEGKFLMDSIRNVSAAIERRYANQLSAQLVGLTREARVLFAVLVVGITLAALVAHALNNVLGRAAAHQYVVTTLLAAQNAQLRDQSDELRQQQARLEERTAEAERLRGAAEAANRAKSAFLAMMSHDLRTPLNAIGGYADLLDTGVAGELNAAQRDYVERIMASNRFLLGLINEVLSFAKTEAGQLDIRLEPVEARGVLFSIEPMIAPQIAAANLTYEVCHSCGAAECTAHVMADREKLDQILLNLATNAIKYTPPGGRIELRCGCDTSVVWIAVRDTGPGIPADKLEEIFKPFTQLDTPARGDSRRGVGLGLAISRELARRMGGELSAVSTMGQGSSFTVRLPRSDHPLTQSPSAVR
ncbi:MAG TPA: ATP-binding protein [Gemmatimonadaceae bacterium]|nr:ATP-binding protein [Gemmatimonadaceae bacterium]